MNFNNKTQKEHRDFIKGEENSHKGVGLFINKKREENTLEKVIVIDITYIEAKDYGKDSLSFKFLPYGIKIKVQGKLYSFRTFESLPIEKYYVCNGEPCKKDEDCFYLSHTCQCVKGYGCW